MKRENLPLAQRNRIRARRTKTRKLVAELVEEAKVYEASDNLYRDTTNVLEAMELVLDRAMDLWRIALKQADKLTLDEFWVTKVDAQGNRIAEPNKWLQYDAALRSEIFEMAARMQGLNIDERRARVQEAQMELLGRALQQAAANAGLTEEQQRNLGAALRKELEAAVGTPTPSENSNYVEGTAQEA